MKKDKLKLTDLNVKSFTTSLGREKQVTVVGGTSLLSHLPCMIGGEIVNWLGGEILEAEVLGGKPSSYCGSWSPTFLDDHMQGPCAADPTFADPNMQGPCGPNDGYLLMGM